MDSSQIKYLRETWKNIYLEGLLKNTKLSKMEVKSQKISWIEETFKTKGKKHKKKFILESKELIH